MSRITPEQSQPKDRLIARGPESTEMTPVENRQIAILTVDVEQDCPPYLTTYEGVDSAIPLLLDLLSEEQIPATFFVTGDVGRRFPEVVQRIGEFGHEIGCHGDSHQRLDRMTHAEAVRDVKESAATLRQFADVIAFRAPFLKLPANLFPVLASEGFVIDSSTARFIPLSRVNSRRCEIMQVPCSAPYYSLRLPRLLRHRWFSLLPSPTVLFMHPWELIDMRAKAVPYSCRFNSGPNVLSSLRDTIRYLKSRSSCFLRLRDMVMEDTRTCL